eukprot:gene20990-21741_t
MKNQIRLAQSAMANRDTAVADLCRELKVSRATLYRYVSPEGELREHGAEPMKASKFSDAQKAFILKQGTDGVPVADICRKAGISQVTYFNWKKKYDGMLPPDMRRLNRPQAIHSNWKKFTGLAMGPRKRLQLFGSRVEAAAFLTVRHEQAFLAEAAQVTGRDGFGEPRAALTKALSTLSCNPRPWRMVSTAIQISP